jgi:hypothetical protein
MNGIYLTEQGKKEIEAKMTELEKLKNDTQATLEWNEAVVMINVYKEILSSATILPVYSNWDDVERFPPDNESQSLKTLELKNGVIIQPK